MVLGNELPMPERPTNLDKSRARAFCTFIECGWGLFGHFFSRPSFLSFSLWKTAWYTPKYCFKGSLNLKQASDRNN